MMFNRTFIFLVMLLVTLLMTVPILGSPVGDRYLMIGYHEKNTQRLREVTSLLEEQHIPYSIISNKPMDVPVIAFQDSLKTHYQAFIKSKKNIGIYVDIEEDSIEQVIKLFTANEIPVAKMPVTNGQVEQLPIEGEEKQEEGIDISGTNRLLNMAMSIIGIVFFLLILEGRKREKKKFFKKD